MRATSIFATLVLAAAAGPAAADIYGYIDAEGTAHFSTERVDERYRLFVRGSASFDSASLGSSPAAMQPSPLAHYLASHPGLRKVESVLHDAADEFSLDPALLKAVMAAESAFNPQAVSPKGAIGLMQIMPATAERYGLQGDRRRSLEQKLADPRINIRLAARYLSDLHKLFPSQPELVIASYNAGEGAVRKHNNRVPPYSETRNYVQVVKQFYQLYKPSAQALAVALQHDEPRPRRIRMTLPGRRNMPETMETTHD